MEAMSAIQTQKYSTEHNHKQEGILFCEIFTLSKSEPLKKGGFNNFFPHQEEHTRPPLCQRTFTTFRVLKVLALLEYSCLILSITNQITASLLLSGRSYDLHCSHQLCLRFTIAVREMLMKGTCCDHWILSTSSLTPQICSYYATFMLMQTQPLLSFWPLAQSSKPEPNSFLMHGYLPVLKAWNRSAIKQIVIGDIDWIRIGFCRLET